MLPAALRLIATLRRNGNHAAADALAYATTGA